MIPCAWRSGLPEARAAIERIGAFVQSKVEPQTAQVLSRRDMISTRLQGQ